MKTPIAIILLLLFFCCISATVTKAQEPDTFKYHSGEEDSIIYLSKHTVLLEAKATVRFSTTSRVYLKWTAPPVMSTGYSVKYKLLGASSWTTVSNSTLEIVITSLQLDTTYLLEILPTGMTDLSAYKFNGMFSTRPQSEPLEVSHKLFNQLMGWFADESPTNDFCEAFGDMDVHLYEKLSFLQKYAFDNEDFTIAGSSIIISDWYPARFDTLTDIDCLPVFLIGCRCQIISKGTNHATPGKTDYENLEIDLRVVQKIVKGHGDKTYIDRFEAGAAKFVSLRQNENAGGMSYEMTNMQEGDDVTSTTTTSSEIQFFLACLAPNGGGWTTNLPVECQCDRPLYVSYEYATNLYVKAEKTGCCISRGAAAQAEDLALVVVYNGRTGALTALDAGKHGIGKQCSSTWNTEWWLNLLDVAQSVANYYVLTLDTSVNQIPTVGQIDTFFDALGTLIGTPFMNTSGSCGELEDDEVLVTGGNTLALLPNEPIRIILSSSYYVRTNGFGKYENAAAVASDYFLMGVVESEQTAEVACCGDKFASYIAGSLSVPSGGDVEVYAPNTIANRLSDVGCELATYGSWNGYVENPNTGCIPLTAEFNLLNGPSCIISGRFQQTRQIQPQLSDQHVKSYPSLLQDEIFVEVEMKDNAYSQITLLDMSGKVVMKLYSDDLSSGFHRLNFPIQHLTNGSYILNCRIGGLIIIILF